jgi:hypothetical protein
VSRCDLCSAPGSGAWLLFDFGRIRRRRPTVGRYVVELEFCESCLPLVEERSTPTSRPYSVAVPSREWPWPARARAS